MMIHEADVHRLKEEDLRWAVNLVRDHPECKGKDTAVENVRQEIDEYYRCGHITQSLRDELLSLLNGKRN
ncbi:hypothetical protein Pan258_02200 [Symmachiella dynata]|nr:hypothetical protein Pan258_02200 [Symmachiella dynata]